MEKTFRKKKPGILATLIMTIVVPLSCFMIITAENPANSSSLFLFKIFFEVVPAIVWKPLFALISLYCLVAAPINYLGAHKSRLVLSDRGVSYESGLPNWWPFEKSVSMDWGEAEALVFPMVGMTMKNPPVALKSKKGQIVIADGGYEQYEEILEEIGKHVKFKDSFS